MSNNLLPETGFIRVSEIIKLIPIGKSTWWAGVKAGRFPQSVKLGKRTTAWRVEEIHNLIANLDKEGK
jgi:predicted DNA-binding transcriptional regulator AlpA